MKDPQFTTTGTPLPFGYVANSLADLTASQREYLNTTTGDRSGRSLLERLALLQEQARTAEGTTQGVA